jgi:hypothetical protein
MIPVAPQLPGRPVSFGAEPGPTSRYAAREVEFGALQAELDAIPSAWHLVAALTAGEGSTVVLLLEQGAAKRAADAEARAEAAEAARDAEEPCMMAGCAAIARPRSAWCEAHKPPDWVPKESFEVRLAHAENVSLRAEVERWKAAQREAAEASMRHESQRDEARIALQGAEARAAAAEARAAAAEARAAAAEAAPDAAEASAARCERLARHAEDRLRQLEDFRRAYDAWAAADEHTAAKLFDEMLESREALRAADDRERCQPSRPRCTRHSPRCPRCVEACPEVER